MGFVFLYRHLYIEDMSPERSESEYIKELEQIAKAASNRAKTRTIKGKLNEINERLAEKAKNNER